MSGFEIAGLVLGVVGLVPIFKEGYVMVKEYRKKRKFKLLVSNNSTSTLKDTLQHSSTALATRYDGFHSAYGAKFATGDNLSREELSKIIIILQGEIILHLRSALTTGTIQNTGHLNSVAATSRENAITVLSQLAQRLAGSGSINSYPRYQQYPHYSAPDTSQPHAQQTSYYTQPPQIGYYDQIAQHSKKNQKPKNGFLQYGQQQYQQKTPTPRIREIYDVDDSYEWKNTCKKCYADFDSRNELFRHLDDFGHYVKND